MVKISDESAERILLMARNGHGRNAIARAVGCSVGTVTNITRKHGVTFDASAVKAAAESRRAQCASIRAELELGLLEDARRLRAQVFSPYEYVELGTVKTGDHQSQEWFTYEAEKPLPADQLKLVQAVGIAVDKSQRIADAASDAGVEHAKSMLAGLLESLGEKWAETQAAEA